MNNLVKMLVALGFAVGAGGFIAAGAGDAWGIAGAKIAAGLYLAVLALIIWPGDD